MGTKMNTEEKTEYLGAMLDKKAVADSEITRRIQLATHTWKKMEALWKMKPTFHLYAWRASLIKIAPAESKTAHLAFRRRFLEWCLIVLNRMQY